MKRKVFIKEKVNRKRILSAFLAFNLLLLPSCSSGQNGQNGRESSENITKADLSILNDTVENTIEIEKNTVKSPKIYIEKNYPYETDLNGRVIVTGEYPTIWVDNAGYEPLKNSLNEYNNYLRNAREEEIQEFKGYAQLAMDSGVWFEDAYYYSECEAKITRADSQVVSILSNVSNFSGQPHPNSYFETCCFDTQNGNILHPSDIFNDPASIPDLLETQLLASYDNDIFIVDDISDTILEELQNIGELKFTVDYNGVTFYFSPYELAYYAAGFQTVTLLFDEYPDLIKTEYLPTTNSYITPIMAGVEYPINSKETLLLDFISNDEYNNEWTIAINFHTISDNNTHDQSFTTETYAYGFTPFLVRINDKNFLYLEMLEDNDYKIMDIFAIDTNKIEKIATLDRAFRYDVPLNTDDLELMAKTHLLSTNSCWRSYRINAQGMPEENTNFDWIQPSVIENLILKQDLTAEIYTLDDHSIIIPTGNKITLSEGTALYFYATDRNTYVDMKTSAGEIVRFYVNPEWPQTIDGVEVSALFDGMMYGG